MVVKTKKKVRAPSEDELDALSGSLDMESAVEEYEKTKSESSSGGNNFVTLADGDNLLRFLPPLPGMKVPWVRFMQHRIPGSNPRGQDKDGWDRNLVCPASIPKEDGSKRSCPICKLVAKMKAAAHPNDAAARENIRAMQPKLRIITEVIDMTTEESEEKGVQLFAYGSMIDDALISILKGRFKFNFTSAKDGAPVLIERVGTGLETKYKNIRAIAEERSPLPVQYLRDRTDLSKFLTLPTREEMETAIAKLTGAAPAKAAPTRPAKSTPAKPTKAPKKAPRVEYDDEDELDEDDFDDDDLDD